MEARNLLKPDETAIVIFQKRKTFPYQPGRNGHNRVLENQSETLSAARHHLQARIQNER